MCHLEECVAVSTVLEVDSLYSGETERYGAKQNSLLLERTHRMTQLDREEQMQHMYQHINARRQC